MGIHYLKVEDNAVKQELILIILNYESIANKGKLLFKNNIYLIDNKMYIEWFSEMLRIAPNYNVRINKLGDSFIYSNIRRKNALIKQDVNSLREEVNRIVNSKTLKIRCKKEKRIISYESRARYLFYQTEHPWLEYLELIFVIVPIISLTAMILLSLIPLADNPYYGIDKENVLWIAFADFVFIVIFCLLTWVQTRKTRYEA